MEEQSEVERLTEAAEKAKADLATALRLKDQRENLLPELEKRQTLLSSRQYQATRVLQEVEHAIADIKDGTPTDYRLRGPRKPKKFQPEPHQGSESRFPEEGG